MIEVAQVQAPSAVAQPTTTHPRPARTSRRVGGWARWVAFPLAALTLLAGSAARAETLVSKFIRIDPEPTTDEKTGTPVIPMLIELGVPEPLTTFSDGCFTGGTGAKVNRAALECMSAKIEHEGYEKQHEFPIDNAHIVAIVDQSPQPMDLVDATLFKEAQADNAGVAWLILMDASSSVGTRWNEMRDVATQLIKAMGPHDAVMVRLMDDKATRDKTKWLPASGKQAALTLIAKTTETYKSGGPVDTLIARIEKESMGSFQDLLKSGVEGTDAIPLVQSLVILSDGGDTTAAGFAGGATSLAIHERLVKGDLGLSDAVRMPIPVVSVWFPKDVWGGFGGIEDQYRANEYQWMSNIATPEVGGYFDIVMDGDAGKAAKISKRVHERFDNLAYVEVKASCLDMTGEQTFKLFFEDTKSKIIPDSWSKVGVVFNFAKWLLAVDKKKTEDVASKKPLQPGETFEVFGEFCWGSNAGAAEAYFVTEADAADVRAASTDRTGKRVKTLLQGLIAKGQKAETVQVSPLSAKFRAPTTASLFDNKGESFALNVVILDNKALRASAKDKAGLLVLKAAKAPLPKGYIVAAVGGGVVVILLIAILARGGGGGGSRQKKRRGGAPPTPGPIPGQPPGGSATEARAQFAVAAGTAPAPFPMGATAPPMHAGALPIAAPTAFAAPAPVAWNAPPVVAHPPATAFIPAAPANAAAAGFGGGFGINPGDPTAPPNRGGTPAMTPQPRQAAPNPYPAYGHAASPMQPLQALPGVKGATSFPTPCPNPSCAKSVMIPPGGTAQCAFCGVLVDAKGHLIGPLPEGQAGFGLTGHADEASVARAVAASGSGHVSSGVNVGTVALQSPSTSPLRAALLAGAAGNFRVLAGIESRVGRDGAQCSIAMNEPRISGVHATLKVDAGTLLVRDDKSHNGTFVNGNRIPPGTWVPVPGGSQLRFGPIEFVVQHEP